MGIAVVAALAAACNDNTLTGLPDPCMEPQTQPITASAESLQARSIGQVYRPANHVASSATAATANELIEALGVDLDLVTARSLDGHPTQSAEFTDLGTVQPTQGSTFVWLSTGVAGAGTPRTLDPSAFGTQQGTDFFDTCGSAEHDCVELTFSFVVPDDMHSVKFDFNFMSTEFPEYVSAGYNDEFTVRLTSPSHSYSNIVFDDDGSLVNIDSAFFDEPCTALAGTGFDLMGEGGCDAGATGLLHTTAPVEPGETVTLAFRLLDRGDGIYDSAVAIDNLQVTSNDVTEPETNPCD